MTPTEVHNLLKANRDERGAKKWKERFPTSPLTNLGIGLTKLRKLAKQIDRSHSLSMKLWESDVYEAKVIALLIDEPKHITRKQVEQQVEQLSDGQLSHVFSACGASLAKVSFIVELVDDWIVSEDSMRRSCGFGLLYELSKSKKKSAPNDDYFSKWIAYIDDRRKDADVDTLMAMAGALLGLGKRSARLNVESLAVARAIGPVDWDSSGNCDPFDVVKHLDNDRLRKKLGIG